MFAVLFAVQQGIDNGTLLTTMNEKNTFSYMNQSICMFLSVDASKNGINYFWSVIIFR